MWLRSGRSSCAKLAASPVAARRCLYISFFLSLQSLLELRRRHSSLPEAPVDAPARGLLASRSKQSLGAVFGCLPRSAQLYAACLTDSAINRCVEVDGCGLVATGRAAGSRQRAAGSRLRSASHHPDLTCRFLPLCSPPLDPPQSIPIHANSDDYINATGTLQFDDTGAASVNFVSGMAPATQALFLSCVSANSPCYDYQPVS